MKILFISASSDPFKDVSSGTNQRTHFLLKACISYAKTDVCTFVKGVESDNPLCNVVFSSDIKDSGISYAPLFDRIKILYGRRNPELLYRVNQARADVIDRLIAQGNYDLIAVRYIENAISCGLFKYADRLVIDVDDNPVVSHRMRISVKKGFFRMFPKLRTIPDKIIFNFIQKSCRFTFFSNPEESRYCNSSYLPNIPLLENNDVTVGQKDSLFFVGALNYMPNRHGISHFIDKVWPSLKADYPSLTLRIAGTCDDDELIAKWSLADGVEYLGFVDDIRKEYINSKVVIVPIYKGTGTNIKLLEGMSMGKACVTTPAGMRGFKSFLKSGKDLFVADSDENFSCLISTLLKDDILRSEICHNAIETIRNNFSEDIFIQIFSDCLKK